MQPHDTDAREDVDVLILGAGPTGIALAAELHRRGIAAMLIDRQAEGANTSRAAVIHARTLEVLEPLGVVPALLDDGIRIPSFRARERDRVLMEIDFGPLPTPYNFVLACPQDRTEAILLTRLRALGGDVTRPLAAHAIRPAADHVAVDVGENGTARTIRAHWLIGCDGGHSIARESAGIGFAGGVYDESFALADCRMDWPLAPDEASMFLAPKGIMVIVPLPEERFRLIALVDEAPEHPDPAFFQTILTERGPSSGAMLREIVWASRFRVQHRVAETLRRGRILLCGDAAHVHSPAGGQGMNTGIQDAVSLVDPLVGTLGGGDEAPLDVWAQERLAIARDVVTTTDRLTRMATLESRPARALRNAAMSLLGHLPGITHHIARQLSELDNR